MKRLLAILISAVMILSMIPVMALTASAAGEGLWTTARNAEDDDPDDYCPAPGYHYTSEGFSTVSNDNHFAETTPFYRVKTKEAVNLKDGVNIKFRIDQFSYRGEVDGDEWISICIWENDEATPGSTAHGSGYCSLIRGTGNGSANFESYWTVGKDEENGVLGQFQPKGILPSDTVPMDSEGREMYEFDVSYSGGAYSIKLNGREAGGMASISDELNKLNSNGDFYIDIIFHSSQPNGVADLTITEFNGSVPTGTDSKAPEENVLAMGKRIMPDTVPEGQPVLLFDATKQTFNKDPQGQNVNISPKGDNSYHFTVTASGAFFFTWSIKRALNAYGEDFPYVAMLLRNYPGSPSGGIYYCAGENMGPGPACQDSWYLDDDYYWEVGDDFYNLVLCDYTDMWEGTIHGIRYDMPGMIEEDEFDVCYIAIFSSAESALAYANKYMKDNYDVEEITEAPTEAPTEKVTEPATEKVTEAAGTTADTSAAGTPADTTETKAEESKSGCASVIGGVAVLMAAMAAAVALKKH